MPQTNVEAATGKATNHPNAKNMQVAGREPGEGKRTRLLSLSQKDLSLKSCVEAYRYDVSRPSILNSYHNEIDYAGVFRLKSGIP